ncbi:MAG: PAS domain S-box protein [Rubrivivax sp.]|nr:PAS domain S-box protein [Rubrivivax sp.]
MNETPHAPWQSAGARELFIRLPQACLVVQAQSGCIVDCNPALLRAVGYAPQDLLGKPVTTLAPARARIEPGSAWQAMQRGVDFADTDVTVRRRRGQPRPMSASGSSLTDGQGRTRYGVTVLRDLARHRQAELAMAERTRQWRGLAHDALLAQGRERERIAAGLHDDIGQTLAMVGFKLGELGQGLQSEEALRLISELRSLVGQAARATRTATFELSCPLLEQLGLKAALESVARTAESNLPLRVCVEGNDPVPALPEPMLGVVYRVVRELLLNVRKHAQATQASVRLHGSARAFRVEVSDNGIGFDASPDARRFSPQGGYGLVSASAQLQALGGRLELQSAPHAGTRALMVLPLGSGEAGAPATGHWA